MGIGREGWRIGIYKGAGRKNRDGDVGMGRKIDSDERCSEG